MLVDIFAVRDALTRSLENRNVSANDKAEITDTILSSIIDDAHQEKRRRLESYQAREKMRLMTRPDIVTLDSIRPDNHYNVRSH